MSPTHESMIKALTIPVGGGVSIVKRPRPAAKSDEVLVKVAYVGLCGSDLHYFNSGANGSFSITAPLVPGHEFSGTIEEDPTGEFRAGTAVTCHPAFFGAPDPRIPFSQHVWPGGSYMGSAAVTPHRDGAASEVIRVRRDKIFLLPPRLSLKRASLAEPLAVALHAIGLAQARRTIRSSTRVAVSGCGPIGLLLLRALVQKFGVRPDAVDLKASARGLAVTLGAAAALAPQEFTAAKSDYDVIFECSGAPAALSSAVLKAAPRGCIVQVGMLPAGSLQIDLSSATAKELSVEFSFRCLDEFPEALDLLADDAVLACIITHEFPMEDAESAFVTAQSDPTASKVVLEL